MKQTLIYKAIMWAGTKILCMVMLSLFYVVDFLSVYVVSLFIRLRYWPPMNEKQQHNLHTFAKIYLVVVAITLVVATRYIVCTLIV